MSSNSRRSARDKRSRKNRFLSKFTIEALERRDMMAADFDFAVDALLSAPATTHTRAAAIANVTIGVGTVGGTGPSSSKSLLGDIAIPTFELQQVPPELGVTFENGILTITGSNEADNIEVVASEGTLYVREVVKDEVLFSMPFGIPAVDTASQKTMAFGGVLGSSLTGIVVNANGGSDWVKVDEGINVPVTMRGGSGNDTLMGGNGADDLSGGYGDDKILGGAGNDVINGEQGNDLLIAGDGNDIVHGGDGDDYMLGGNGNDWLLGEAGNDQLFGEAGNDMLFGGSGQNLMDGGAGNDQIYGGDDIDAMYGGDGDDVIRGLGGDDRIRGEAGNDDIAGGNGDDIVDAGDGHDYVTGDAGNDVLVGGNGNDAIYGGNDQDWISGENGDDALIGGAGNDLIQGGAGTDQIDGGTGSNLTYQTNLPGVQYGQVTQSLSWSDVGDFFGDVWDGIVGVFNWTVDKAKSIGMRFYDWAAHLDDRLYRLAGDLAGALTNWPWEADFWKGLGRSLVDVLEIAGLGEAWEIAFEILKPWQRGMTSDEIAVARSVFGDSIPWDRVRLDEHSLMAWIGRTHVTGFIINSTEDLSDRTMIHELTHVWQYVSSGLVYIPEAIDAQNGEGYDFGGVDGLRATKNAGGGLSSYNREQQGEIVASYFDLIKQARAIEAGGSNASADMREKLDVFVHFVKEVSTLAVQQLDALSPNIFQPPIVADVMTFGLATKDTGAPTPPQPVTGGVKLNTALALDALYAQYTPQPTSKSVDATKVDGELVLSDEGLEPFTTRDLDRAFALL